MYATGTSEEVETQLAEWLMNMIERIESQRVEIQAKEGDGIPKPGVGRA